MNKILRRIKDTVRLRKESRQISRNPLFLSFKDRLFSLVRANENHRVLIGLNQHMGDLCFGMAFWPELQKQYGKDNIYLICEERNRWILLAYGAKQENIMFVEPSLCYWLTNQLVFKKFFEKSGSFIYAGVFQIKKRFRRPGVISSYARNLFGRQVKPTPFPGHLPSTTKGDFVVVNRFASAGALYDSLFVELVSLIAKRGFKVVHNLKTLEGARDEVYTGDPLGFTDLCSRARAVVSLRTGLLDLAIRSISSCLCIYPSGSFRRIFSLSQWETETRLTEITEKEWKKMNANQKNVLLDHVLLYRKDLPPYCSETPR